MYGEHWVHRWILNPILFRFSLSNINVHHHECLIQHFWYRWLQPTVGSGDTSPSQYLCPWPNKLFSRENIFYAMFYKTQRICVLDPCAKYASTTWDFSHVHLYYMHNPDAKNWKTQQPCSTHGQRITLAHASPYVSFSPIYRRTVSNEFACQAPQKKDTPV